MVFLGEELTRGSQQDIGPALATTKQRYVTSIPSGEFDFNDQKVMGEMILYGLPMYTLQTINPTATPRAASSPGVLASRWMQAGPCPSRQGRTYYPQFATITETIGTYYQAINPDVESGIHARAEKPIQPFVGEPVNANVRGVVFEGASYSIKTTFDPVITRVGDSDVFTPTEAAITNTRWLPADMLSLNRLRTLAGEQQRLLILPGQYRQSDAQQRLYDEVSVTLYSSTADDYQPPQMTGLSHAVNSAGTAITFTATLTDDIGLCRALVSYTTGDGRWRSVDLQQIDQTTWQVTLSVSGTVEYFAQAVDLAGNVAVFNNDGYYYAATVSPTPPNGGNQAPNRPDNPVPADGATGVPLSQSLAWQGGDPDAGDALTYTIAFGTMAPPPVIATTTQLTFAPALTYGLHYLWQITATDGQSTTVGPMWQFTTTVAPVAPPAAVPLDGLTVTGPARGFINTEYPFSALAGPISATRPITFTWRGDGLSPVVHRTARLSDTLAASWPVSGTVVISLTAENGAGSPVVATHTMVIQTVPPVSVDPTTTGTVVYTNANNTVVAVGIPAGAVSETTTLEYTPALTPNHQTPANFNFAGQAFELDATQNGQVQTGFVFQTPITVTITYTAADVAGLDTGLLMLQYWDGAAWSSDGITLISHDEASRTIVFQITHLTPFALFEVETAPSPPDGSSRVYLPLIIK